MTQLKNDVFVYAEGGGESDALRSSMRQAFAEFFYKTDLGSTRRPRVVACGSRADALASFTTALTQGRNALLLIDSEAPVDMKHETPPEQIDQWKPWAHLKEIEGWQMPPSARDADCHLMSQCMETWFLADWPAVAKFYGQGFDMKCKPSGAVEKVPKQAVYDALRKATAKCRAKSYKKGAHSFGLLAIVSATGVCAGSPWAQRFVGELLRRKP